MTAPLLLPTGDSHLYKNAPALRLVSHPHTGTVFTRYVLGMMGLKDRREGGLDYLSHHNHEFTRGLVLPDDARIVVPLRDPMLAACSRVNRGWGGTFKHWRFMTTLRGPHFFRVEPPEGVKRSTELRKLAEFVRCPVPLGVDWSPRNGRNDVTGVKAAYKRGEIMPEVQDVWDWLREADDVKAMFRGAGYELPWMT